MNSIQEGLVMIMKLYVRINQICKESKMGSEIKVEIIHKETIKPSSPTPRHLKTSNLSIFDQLTPELYVPLLLFYPNNNEVTHVDLHSLFAERSKLLKSSLSQTLTRFYPFAGRFEYNVSITCNDHGAAYVESQINCPISKILENPDFRILQQLIPSALESKQVDVGHLLLVQINFFECGGITIGVSISHKVADASTLGTFITSWAEIACGSSNATDPPPEFGVVATLFPPQDFFNSPQPRVELAIGNCVTKRFVFDASKIAALKSKVASAAVPNPTRVEVVSALIWKCALQASRSNMDYIKPSVLCQVVNMRKRSGEAVTENIMGNYLWYFAAMTVDTELEFESLVDKLRKGIEGYKEKYPKGVSGDEALERIKESGNILAVDNVETYSCSSWCRFPFYKADFGWGEPAWMSIRSSQLKNTIMLMDMSDGVGIEACVILKEEDMAIFESNEDLLAYASLIQTVF